MTRRSSGVAAGDRVLECRLDPSAIRFKEYVWNFVERASSSFYGVAESDYGTHSRRSPVIARSRPTSDRSSGKFPLALALTAAVPAVVLLGLCVIYPGAYFGCH